MQKLLSRWALMHFTATEKLQNILFARKTANPRASKPVRRSKEAAGEIGMESNESGGENEERRGRKLRKEKQSDNEEIDKNQNQKDEFDKEWEKEMEKFTKVVEEKFGKDMANQFRELDKAIDRKMRLKFGLAFIAALFFLLFAYLSSKIHTHPQSGQLTSPATITWDYFLQNVVKSGEINKIIISPNDIEMARKRRHLTAPIIVHMNLGSKSANGISFATSYTLEVPNILKFESTIRQIEKEAEIPPERWANIQCPHFPLVSLAFVILILVTLATILLYFRAANKVIGKFPSMSMFSSAQFRVYDTASKEGKKALKIKFRDVAGLHEAKVEISEFVDYLRKPQKYTKLGAKLPKGALLTGPPGCGKTLLAKALAAESSVPFININGTEFVEMIGGLGASRVRQLFTLAKSKAPCIIYIDEIEAIGRKRQDQGFGNGDSEMEQTLNQLLVEMDGMDSTRGIVVIASTNRPDILDKALLRPGRFDRHVNVDLPTLLERKETFDLYLQKIKKENLLTGISQRLAQMTPGFSGADIANVVNEAAIHAATEQKKMVRMEDIDHAMEKIIAGPKKRSRILVDEEREIVAFHESGHALVGWLLEHTEALLKVTIIPRTTAALGFAQYSPRDRKIFSKEELFDRMCMMLGGRAAENVAFGRITTGASNDLEKVTKNAQAMVKWYGMSELVGPISFIPGDGVDERSTKFMEKPYSKKLGAIIDQEVSKLVAEAYYSTENLLKENRGKLDKLAKTLLERETLNYEDVKRLIGPPRYGDKNVVDLAEEVLPDPIKPDYSI